MQFRSIVIEGGDQIGKGDITQYLLKKFKKEKINFKKISFPIYSSPIGYVVRMILENGMPNIDGVNETIGTERELEIRIVTYALNRLEALESFLRRFKNKEVYCILDRSPFSVALTIAYGLGGMKSIKNREVFDLVKLALSFEQPFINTFNIKDCIIHLMAEYDSKGWMKTRTDGDLYEKQDIQEVADDVYDVISEVVGSGWIRIYTKRNGVFRDRKDIYKEVDKIVDSLGYKSTKTGERMIFDILEISEDIYGVNILDCGDYKKYFRNIRLDDNAKNKETYSLAYKIGEFISGNCEEVTFLNGEIKNNVRELLDRYPEVFLLINHHLGEKFTQLFKNGIYD